MSKLAKAGYYSAFFLYVGMWVVAIACYVNHLQFTVRFIGDVTGGYAFYLFTGVIFPPMGIFNGVVLFLG